VEILPRQASAEKGARLFFINLGGYKQGDFEEYHYKLVFAAADKGVAIQLAKQNAFYLHAGFKGAESHVDDKFGVDVDDCYEISDILPPVVEVFNCAASRRLRTCGSSSYWICEFGKAAKGNGWFDSLYNF
jgi:hypothetical protein